MKSRHLLSYSFLLLITLGTGCVTNVKTIKTDIKTTSTSSTNPFDLPQRLGDDKVTVDAPKKGYVYSCNSHFREGGAQHLGDWVDGNTWYPTRKIQVTGSVDWPTASFNESTTTEKRILKTNSLPAHHTGIFPIKRTDPAYKIDPNPNTIKSQQFTFQLPLSPLATPEPQCVSMGPVGIMTNGVLLYNALDAAGRDAVAHEVQDSCDGHPQSQGQYHYHGFSRCLTSMKADTVIGYALDGFGITGPQKNDGTFYTSEDLDECHGITSEILWDGKKTVMYHYVMTADYPYTVGCFKGIPAQNRMRP